MLLVFDSTTPVVDFGANSRPLEWGVHKWFLWPAFAYRMLLPGRRTAPFNVIQRAVLDMCRAGIRNAGAIAARLALPADLITFVIEQLGGMGALDDASAPTPRALRFLDESDEPSDVEEAGYVLVDGHSLRIWPRIHRGSLPVVDVVDFDRGAARFDRGTQGRPYKVSATVLWPDRGSNPREPNAYEAQKAARRHARRLRAYRRERDDDGSLEGLDFTRLRLLGTEPEPVFVAACVFLPKDARQRSWLVTDPCGLGVSDVIRPTLEKLAKDGRHNVKKLLEEVAGQAWQIDADDLALYFTEAATAAMARVSQHLGEAAQLLPRDVIERLADADVRLDGARSAKPIEDYLGNAYAALESVFGWLVSLYPDLSLLAALDRAAPVNAELLQKIAGQLGFSKSPKTRPLLSVTYGAVKGALDPRYSNKTLPGRLAAALLAAQRDSNHPLALLATRDPDALEFLAEIGRPRIDASHFTSKTATLEEVTDLRNRLFVLLRNLVGAGPMDAGAETAAAPTWGADLPLRIRAQAEKAAEAYPGLEDRPDLRIRVIEMHDATLLVKLLADSDATILRLMSTRIRDAAIAMAIVMEAVFAEIGREAGVSPAAALAISDDREQNAEQIAAAATALGFTLEVSGRLPKSLTHARAKRIQRAAQGRGETLSARVVAQLLLAQEQPDHPLWEIAKTVPGLLLDMGRLVAARGHGDDVTATAAEVAEIEAMIAKNLRAIISVID